MSDKTIVLAIDDVEAGLVHAVNEHSQALGKPLRGLALVNTRYPDIRNRSRDTTGLFEEIICDFNDADALQQALKPYTDSILAVTCRQESSVQGLRQVVPYLPYVNTPSESALLWSTEKHLMRDRLRGYDKALAPKYRYLTDYKKGEALTISQGLQFPVIVKPNGLASSILVSRCDSAAELDSCLLKTFSKIREIYSRDFGRGEPSVLVEEMIQGDMYSTDAYVSPTGEVYCLPFVQIITAHSIGLEGFNGHHSFLPTNLTDQEIAAAQKATIDAVKALNLSSTTAHVELFKTPDGAWKIIEVGPRIGGYRETLYREAYDIDHYYNDLAVRMGLPPNIPDKPRKHAASINIYADKEGIVESITGIEEASKLPSVVFLKSYFNPGDMALFASNGGRFPVDAILSNENLDELTADVARVRELVQVNISDK